MKKVIVFILVCQLFQYSCKKDEPHTIVEGVVVDYGSGQPLFGVACNYQEGSA